MAELTGQVLGGRYRVEAFLGRGGMADVYKVWDQQRAVYLALKVLHADLAEDQVFLDRFEREAQTLEVLQHPNIVRFYGLEKAGQSAFILMDFIEGLTLRQEIFLNKRGLLPERIFEVMQPVCAALHYAHQMNLIHCDIKPANIMTHRNGTVYLTDFGIARMTEGNTQTLGGVGTPAYMAPEQLDGKVPTPAADLYSLGVVLFEMLTGGQRPFNGDASQTTGTTAQRITWEKHHTPPPSPRKYNANISAEMEAVVLRCLERSPRRRFSTALDLMHALEVVTHGVQDSDEVQTRIDLHKKPARPAAARKTSPADNPQPASGTGRPPAGKSQPAAGKSQPAAGRSQPAAGRSQPAADKPPAATPPAIQGPPQQAKAKMSASTDKPMAETSKPQSAAGKPQPAAGKPLPGASRLRLDGLKVKRAGSGRVKAVTSMSNQAAPAGAVPEIRAARKKAAPDGAGAGAAAAPSGAAAPPTDPASRASKPVAGKNGKARHNPQRPTGKPQMASLLKSRIAKIMIGGVVLLAIVIAILTQTAKTPAYTPTSSPSAGPAPTSLTIQDTRAAPPATPSAELPVLSPPLSTETPLAQLAPTLTGGSDRLAFASNRGGSLQVWIMTVSNPENRHQVTDEPAGACQPAWSPDGTQLAYTTPCKGWSVYFPGSTIKTIRLEDGKIRDLPVKTPGVAGTFDPAWSPDGVTLAYTALIGEKTEIRTINLQDEKIRTLANRGTKNAQPAWSRDGKLIAFISRDARNWDELWSMRANGDSQEVLGRSGMFAEPVWAPDGLHILVSMNPGNNVPVLAMFDRGNPTQGAAVLLKDDFNISHSSISPDGQWIAFWTTKYKNSPEIMLSSIDGKGVRPLTNDMLRNFQPVWSPK